MSYSLIYISLYKKTSNKTLILLLVSVQFALLWLLRWRNQLERMELLEAGAVGGLPRLLQDSRQHFLAFKKNTLQGFTSNYFCYAFQSRPWHGVISASQENWTVTHCIKLLQYHGLHPLHRRSQRRRSKRLATCANVKGHEASGTKWSFADVRWALSHFLWNVYTANWAQLLVNWMTF